MASEMGSAAENCATGSHKTVGAVMCREPWALFCMDLAHSIEHHNTIYHKEGYGCKGLFIGSGSIL